MRQSKDLNRGLTYIRALLFTSSAILSLSTLQLIGSARGGGFVGDLFAVGAAAPLSYQEMGNSADVNCCHGDAATLSLPSPWKPGGSICTWIRPLPSKRGSLREGLANKVSVREVREGSNSNVFFWVPCHCSGPG